jgi:lipid II:glycine glycyltransferase (peptidoglycan interpeptide bridge formation enzyme)
MSSSKIRQIKKGLAAGAQIVEAQEIGEVRQFYDLLHDLYKSKIKKPLPGWSFFKSFHDLSLKEYIGKYILVKRMGKVIGGIMCPLTKDRSLYEWYVAGDDRGNKEFYPSVLATWGAIEYAARNNFLAFDFMGAGKPDGDYGVREFKAKFGGRLVDFGRFEKVHKSNLYRIAKIGFWFWQKLKRK